MAIITYENCLLDLFSEIMHGHSAQDSCIPWKNSGKI